MADGSVIRRLVTTASSDAVVSADPDDPVVRGFADFGLPSSSPLATEDQLRNLEAWRDNLRIPANSAFLDGTLLRTIDALLGWHGPRTLTPVTLWELTAFIDALVCFDRLYCVAGSVRVSDFNERLGENVLAEIPDPDPGMLRRLAAHAAANGLSDMRSLRKRAGHDDAFGQEVQALVDGWRAVFGPDFPSDGPFDIAGIDTQLAQNWMAAPGNVPGYLSEVRPGVLEPATRAIDGVPIGTGPDSTLLVWLLVQATRLPQAATVLTARPPLQDRQHFAATATYRTYINQGIANALALPYMPGTLRMPFRRLFVERAAEVQDELVSVALADQIFARQQPSSPLILPFFTASVLQGAATLEGVWAQMARVRAQSASFRRKRADLDHMLERSQVSPEALRVQSAIRDEALKLADLAGTAQESAAVALGVVAQTGIMPLASVLKTGLDAAHGVGRSGGWTRIWRRLFHRHEYFLAQTNSQAIALTNALPQIQQLWELPKIGGYLDQFASTTQRMGRVLRG